MGTTAQAAAPLHALILLTETGKSAVAAYETIIGHREDDLVKPRTSILIDEVLKEQSRWMHNWKMPSGAAGGYRSSAGRCSGSKRL